MEQKEKWIEQFNSEMKSLIDEYVKEQDFHAVETPLKSDRQYKNELKEELSKKYNFEAISRGIFNGVNLINSYLLTLNDQVEIEKARKELDKAFEKLSELFDKALESSDLDLADQINPDLPIWTSLFGMSDETLGLIYESVLNCFENNEIENSKDILQILLMFAPTIPAFWNALGFCFQTEGNLDEALNQYLVAESMDEDLPETHFYLARCYLAMNKRCLAQEQVEKLSKRMDTLKNYKNQWEAAINQLANEVSS